MEQGDDSSDSEPEEETSMNISTQRINLRPRHDSYIEAL